MTAEQLETWCQALESGNYIQCRKTLKKGNNYCCLGVACVTLGIEMNSDSIENDAYNALMDLGIYTTGCYDLNDRLFLDFKEIANELRTNTRQYVKIEDSEVSKSQ